MAKRAKICGIVATAAALAGIAVAQSKPNDVDGWGKVKWGMTLAEARAAYGAEAKECTEANKYTCQSTFTTGSYLDKLAIDNIKVGDMNARASLQVPRGSDNITQITLSFPGIKTIQRSGSDVYETLKALLIQKYGAPSSEDRKRDGREVVKTVLWTFPSTSILLRWVEVPSYDIGYVMVNVQYTAVDKKAQSGL